MKKVKNGDLVTIEYEGMIENGETVESSGATGPFELEVGQNLLPPGFENAILGMQIGENKTVVLQPEEAYGPRDESLLHTIDRDVLGKGINPKPGMVLGMTVNKDGRPHQVPALVTAISGEQVTVDFNHPLAGRTITYTFTVKAIK